MSSSQPHRRCWQLSMAAKICNRMMPSMMPRRHRYPICGPSCFPSIMAIPLVHDARTPQPPGRPAATAGALENSTPLLSSLCFLFPWTNCVVPTVRHFLWSLVIFLFNHTHVFNLIGTVVHVVIDVLPPFDLLGRSDSCAFRGLQMVGGVLRCW